TPSWGGMVADGYANLYANRWLIWPPGTLIALTAIAFVLLADAVRDVLAERWAPQSRTSRHTRRSRRRTAQREAPRSPGLTTPRSDRGALLEIEGLTVEFSTDAGPTTAVEDVSFDIRPGETVGLMGESGCGKTVTATAILGLLPGTGRIAA